MKLLIGVMSCEKDAQNGSHDAIRQTWISRIPPEFDYKIFVGKSGFQLKDDEVRLDVPDGPHLGPHPAGLTQKSQAIKRWALEHNYDFLFKADRDTYIAPRRLLNSGFEKYDYVGHFPMWPRSGFIPVEADARGMYPYASGGCGYWHSRRAMEAMANAPLDDRRLDSQGYPAEDLWVPNVLFPLGIFGYHDHRYLFKGNCLDIPDAITVHLSKNANAYLPEWMFLAHRHALSAGVQ